MAEERFFIVPIGYIRSPIRRTAEAPHQGRDARTEVTIEVDPRYAAALEGIEERGMLQIICWLHLAERDRLRVHPRGNPTNPARGVFATRSPLRPNPLALYTAEILKVEGNRVRVLGVDAVEGTPVVDIRPHIHRLDD